jgi:ribosome biogenesis protein MAK21
MRKGASAPTISAEGPLNNEKFAKSKEEEIPVDQVFFHRYFSQKLAEEEHVREKQNKNKRKRKAGDDDDSDDADSEDDISIGDDAAEAADLLPDDSDIENAPEDDEVADEDDDSELDEDEVWKAMKASMPPAKGDADLMEDSGSNEDGDDDDDDSVAEFAYSDSEDGKDAAMDAILAGEDGEELDEDDGENSELGEDDMPSFFPDDDDVDDAPAFDEDEDDLIGSDEDIELGDGIKLPESAASSRKDAKNKKRKLKHLPAFASADDWKDLIDRDSE